MFRFLLRPVLLLTLLIALLIVLIRAQPYDDSDLRAFLTPPDGCPAPCFMGIRPGVTTTEEAIAIIEASPLFVYTPNSNAPDRIFFRVNTPHNLILDSNSNSLLLENKIVQGFRLQTNISVGELWAAYGQPDWGSRAYAMGASNIYYAVGYDQNIAIFSFEVSIERHYIAFKDVLQEKMTLRFDPKMNEYANMQPRLWLYTNRDVSSWRVCC